MTNNISQRHEFSLFLRQQGLSFNTVSFYETDIGKVLDSPGKTLQEQAAQAIQSCEKQGSARRIISALGQFMAFDSQNKVNLDYLRTCAKRLPNTKGPTYVSPECFDTMIKHTRLKSTYSQRDALLLSFTYKSLIDMATVVRLSWNDVDTTNNTVSHLERELWLADSTGNFVEDLLVETQARNTDFNDSSSIIQSRKYDASMDVRSARRIVADIALQTRGKTVNPTDLQMSGAVNYLLEHGIGLATNQFLRHQLGYAEGKYTNGAPLLQYATKIAKEIRKKES